MIGSGKTVELDPDLAGNHIFWEGCRLSDEIYLRQKPNIGRAFNMTHLTFHIAH